MAPVLSLDGKTLYVCNRFDNDVGVIDLVAGKEVCCIAVEREPVAAALTKDGKFLLVANLLPAGRADVSYVAAVVSVIDTASRTVIKELKLPNGSASLNDIRVSPDGQYAVVTHIVGRFSRLTTHVTGGWMNANALTLIDLPTLTIHGTMLLDDSFQGAANPWSVAWSSDGATLVVTHAGTHDVSVIDFSKWLAQLPTLPANYDPAKVAASEVGSKPVYEQPDNLPFFAANSRVRVKLPAGDLGPRAVVVVGHMAYMANYFSDTLSVIDLSAPHLKVKSIPLGTLADDHLNMVREGEFYFNDASLCYEGWQSCASCHPGGGRVDGLNWDLLNDGVGNPKNTKSLLLATKTAPLMSLGVRADAPTAVLAGIQHILFNSRPKPEVVDSILAYLGSLKPVPSPHLVHGKLSEAAERGKKVFSKASCIDCHESELFTDQQPHDVGTRNPHDKPTDKFYTPTLIEVWRTAPYLHDGSAVTIRDVLTTRNASGQHGDVTGLSKQELDDLCEYVLSL
jgi:YVTN family beta-propeller protein